MGKRVLVAFLFLLCTASAATVRVNMSLVPSLGTVQLDFFDPGTWENGILPGSEDNVEVPLMCATSDRVVLVIEGGAVHVKGIFFTSGSSGASLALCSPVLRIGREGSLVASSGVFQKASVLLLSNPSALATFSSSLKLQDDSVLMGEGRIVSPSIIVTDRAAVSPGFMVGMSTSGCSRPFTLDPAYSRGDLFLEAPVAFELDASIRFEARKAWLAPSSLSVTSADMNNAGTNVFIYAEEGVVIPRGFAFVRGTLTGGFNVSALRVLENIVFFPAIHACPNEDTTFDEGLQEGEGGFTPAPGGDPPPPVIGVPACSGASSGGLSVLFSSCNGESVEAVAPCASSNGFYFSGPTCGNFFCPTECASPRGSCVTGDPYPVCECTPPWTGPTCQQATCPGCQGTCDLSGAQPMCDCGVGFCGDLCDVPCVCENSNCLNGGTCNNVTGACDCVEGQFRGSQCHLPVCPGYNAATQTPNCNGHATSCDDSRVPHVCVCAAGWTGEACERPSCANFDECQNGGRCVEFSSEVRCECGSMWDGPRCEVEVREAATVVPSWAIALICIAATLALVIPAIMLYRLMIKRKNERLVAELADQYREQELESLQK